MQLLVIVPGLSISVRRFHDVNKSGWMLLLGIISIVELIYLCLLSVNENNKYDK